jgi:hypothetical protein
MLENDTENEKSIHRKRYENDMLENDTENEKSIHRKRNHRIENMLISIDNGTSNRKHRNHEWTYMQHVHNQMSDQQSNMNITAHMPIL